MDTMAPAAKRRRARTRAKLSLLFFTAAILVASFTVFDMVGRP
jgi:hypothetical protein